MRERHVQDHQGVAAASTWIVAHAARLWGALLITVLLALTWHTLRGINTHEVRAIFRILQTRPLTVAAIVTVLNIAIMGLYDVVAFAEHPHAYRRTMEIRGGGVLLEQLHHARPIAGTRRPLLAL